MCKKEPLFLGVNALRDWLSRCRIYAGFFGAPIMKPRSDYTAEPGIFSACSKLPTEDERPAQELHIAEIFITENLEFSGAIIESVTNDPPDCVIFPANIGIEICELVDSSYADPHNKLQNPDMPFRQYSICDISNELSRIAVSKEIKLIKAHQNRQAEWNYKELILLVHSDEIDITPEKASAAVKRVTIPSLTEIKRAYLLLSYSPEHKRYPLYKFI